MKKIIITLALIVIAVYTCNRAGTIRHSNASLFGEDNLPLTRFEIAAGRDTILTGLSGTKLFIDANSFADKNGNPVAGKIYVTLKEAITAADIIMGNLTTVSNGQLLSSGGMICVNAEQNANELALANGHTIGVSVPAKNKNDSMMIYRGERTAGNSQINWVEPSDRILHLTSETEMNDTMKESPAPVKIRKPLKPEKQIPGDTILSLVFDTASFPEISMYRNVKFKVLHADNFRSSDSKIAWMDVELKSTARTGIYRMIFRTVINGKDLVKIYTVKPVLEGKDYENAVKEYEKKYQDYETRMAKIEADRIEIEKNQQRLQEEFNKRLSEQQRLQEIAQKHAEETLRECIAKDKKEREKFINTVAARNYIYELSMLGWSNIDRLIPEAQPVAFTGTIADEGELTNISVYVFLKKQMSYMKMIKNESGLYVYDHNCTPILPVGSEAYVIARANKDDKEFFCMKKINIDPVTNVVLTLQQRDFASIRSDFDKLL